MSHPLRPRAAFVSRSLRPASRLLAGALVAGTLVAGGLTSSSAAATASTVRINTGGPALTDVDGHAWKADSYFTGGTTSTSTATQTAPYPGVAKDDRFGMSAYRVPVTNATYSVSLLESEHYWGAAGKRVFDVTAEGKLAVDNLDIYAKAGAKDKSIWVTFTTTVSDGTLDLVFAASKDKSKVDGIVIEPATTAPAAATPSVMWGMDDNATFDSTEAGLGRKFALVRVYRTISDAYGTSRQQALASSGHSLVLSLRSQVNGAWVKYATITSGKYDTMLVNGLAKLNALPTITYMIFQHEPDSDISNGACSNVADSVCGPEFVAAWKHVYNLSKSHGFNRLRWGWTVTSYGFSPQTNVRNNYYWVGTAYTDWIGVDAYNGGCNGNWYGTFSEMLAKSVAWVQQNAPGKSIFVPEYGATEGASPTDKPNFFNDMPSALQQPGYTQIKGLLYWNNKPSNCDFRINTSTASYNAFKSLGLKTIMAAKAPTS